MLLGLLVKVFVPEGDPLVVGIDETLERRWGKKIAAKGVYRDPVRSTHENFVKASGLRWVCVMLLVEIPWAARVWALPFLSALAPSERYAAKRGRRHKKITEWAWQSASRIRDETSMVGAGNTENHTGTAGAVFGDHFIRASPYERGNWCFSAGGLVPQGSPCVCRRFGAGAQRVVGTCDFLRVARGHRVSVGFPRGRSLPVAEYSFFSSWQLTAPIERVWDELERLAQQAFGFEEFAFPPALR